MTLSKADVLTLPPERPPDSVPLRALDVEEKPLEFLIPGWIPFDSVTLVWGEPGIGKTFFWTRLVADLTRGKPTLFETDLLDPPEREPVSCLFLSREDSFDRVLKKRLRQAGADLSRVFGFGQEQEEVLNVDLLSKKLEKWIAATSPALVVIDSLQRFMPAGMDINNAGDVSRVVLKVSHLAARYHVAFLLVHHSNKSTTSETGRQAMAGSGDLYASARAVIAAGDTGDKIAAATIEGSNIKAGAITTSHVSSDFGQTLDLSSNTGINQTVQRISDTAQQASDTAQAAQSIAAQTQQDLDSLVIGGRNYLLNSEMERSLSRASSNTWLDYAFTDLLNDTGATEFTFSVFAMSAEGLTFDFYFENASTSITDLPARVATENYVHYSLTVQLKESYSSADIVKCRIRAKAGTGTVFFKQAMLEVGHTASDWRPAPEDAEEAVETKLASVSAAITNEGDSIRQEVQATYAAASDLSSVQQQLTTLSEQTENGMTWAITQINQLQTDLTQGQQATNAQLQLIQTYMTFTNNGLIIGKAGNPFTFRVINDRLSFYMNDTEVAYLSNNKLYVTQAEILTRMQIGKFAYEPQTNGNLSIVYTG